MLDFRAQFPKTHAAIESGLSHHLHVGCQLAIHRSNQIIADYAVGLSRPGVDMSCDSILIWLSCGKPLAAVGIAKLWESGRLDIDDLVGHHIPEFAVRGKESIRIRHLLTHTGGFRWVDYLPTMPWDTIIARICEAPLEPRWIVGRTAGYHAFTSWYILAEIIRRLDPAHRAYDLFVREEIFLPLGMTDCWMCLSPQQYKSYLPRLGILQTTGQAHQRPIAFDTEERSDICSPAASARGPMRHLAMFYQMLLNRGRPLLMPQTVEALTARHRAGLYDLTFKHVVDWGLGFIVNSAQYGESTVPYGFGPHASPRTFGHGGSQSSVAFADPENELAVALLFNGQPGEPAHHVRLRSTLTAIYEDLELGRDVGAGSDGIP